MNAGSNQEQVQVMRSACLDASHQSDSPPCDPQWRFACMAAVLPGALHHLHHLLEQPQGGMSAEQLQVRYFGMLKHKKLFWLGCPAAKMHTRAWPICM